MCEVVNSITPPPTFPYETALTESMFHNKFADITADQNMKCELASLSLCWTTLWDIWWHGSLPSPVYPVAVAQLEALSCWGYSRKPCARNLSLNVLLNEVSKTGKQYHVTDFITWGQETDYSARLNQMSFKNSPNVPLNVSVPFRGQRTYNFRNLKSYDIKQTMVRRFLPEFTYFW